MFSLFLNDLEDQFLVCLWFSMTCEIQTLLSVIFNDWMEAYFICDSEFDDSFLFCQWFSMIHSGETLGCVFNCIYICTETWADQWEISIMTSVTDLCYMLAMCPHSYPYTHTRKRLNGLHLVVLLSLADVFLVVCSCQYFTEQVSSSGIPKQLLRMTSFGWKSERGWWVSRVYSFCNVSYVVGHVSFKHPKKYLLPTIVSKVVNSCQLSSGQW